MGSTVKKIAKVAIIAAATYYGGKYAMSMMGTGGVAASSSFPTLLSTAGGVGVPSGFLGMGTTFAKNAASAAFNYAKSNPLTSASLLLQAGGAVAQNKYATEAASYNQIAADAQREENRIQQRKSETNVRRVAIANSEQRRILQARNAVKNVGFDPSGTSGYVLGQGALSTDYANVIGNLNVQKGYAADLSTQSRIFGDAKSAGATAQGFASGWSNVTTAGMNIFKTISGGDNGLYARQLTPIA